MDASDSRQLGASQGDTTVLENQEPRCLAISSAGIRTGSQFAGFMSALMSDLIDGRITANVGNAAVNAGGKLLKIVELQLKYGKKVEVIA
jgi:hypothetical protein